MSKDILIAAGAIVLLAACSGDYEALDPVTLSVPLRIQASIAETSGTRVSDNGTEWESGDNIYLYGTVDGTVVDGLNYARYTYQEVEEDDAEKTVFWTAASGDYYFPNTKTVSLTAVHIPGESVESFPADGVLTNQPVQDFLYASTTASYANNNVELEFKHAMAQLSFDFVSSWLTKEELKALTFDITGLSTTGSFNTLTGEATGGTSSTLINQSADTPITIYPLSAATDVIMSFVANNNNYQVTLSGATFAPGKSYAYTVEIDKVEASLVGSEISSTWDNSARTGAIIPPYAGRYIIGDYDYNDYDNRWMYDIVFSDGSYMHTTESSGGEFKESLNLRGDQKDAVRGVVYWLGSPIEKGDVYLPSNCTHGLIVALNDAAPKDYWSKQTSSVNDGDWRSEYADYTWIDVCRYDYSQLQVMYGYGFTTILRCYNEYVNNDIDYVVLPVKYVDEYDEKYSIYNTSGWYLPSTKELGTLCVGISYRLIWGNNGSTPGCAIATAVNNVFKLLGTSIATELSPSYWTGTRQTIEKNSANYVDIDVPTYHYYGGVGYWPDPCWIRAICAF